MGRLIDSDEVSKYVIIGNGDLRRVPTVEAIPKADYETRLKADMVAVLVDIQLEFEELQGKYSPNYDEASQHLCEIIKEKIENVKEGYNTHWILVKDRLPEDGTWNVFTDGKAISVERYKMDAMDHFYPSGRWFELEDAVAWMPLPPHYSEKGGKNGET